MGQRAMREVQRVIDEQTCSMSEEAYVGFLRDLAEWANEKADTAEYAEDFMCRDDE